MEFRSGDRGTQRGEERRTKDRADRGSDTLTRESKKSRSDLNEFFVDGKGIHREVLQKEICRFLGPEAYSKPHTYQGVDGFIIKAVRPFTREMLSDLIRISRNYESERDEMRRRGHRDLHYGESETRRQNDLDVDMVESDDDRDAYPQEDRRYPPAPGYSVPPGQQPMYAPAAPGFPTAQGPYPPAGYQQIGAPVPPSTNPYTSAYPSASYQAASSRPGFQPSPYVMNGPDYDSRAADPYGPRVGSAYPPTFSRETRDPRDTVAYGSNSNRPDIRDVRADPRIDPSYNPYDNPGNRDVRDPSFGYPPGPPPMNTGGNPRGPYPSARGVAAPYDRESPGLRDPYRHEPTTREERRRR